MDEEIVEKPESLVLWNQTVEIVEHSQENKDDEENENIFKPTIVEMKMKEKYVNYKRDRMEKPPVALQEHLASRMDLQENVGGYSETAFVKNLKENITSRNTYMEMTGPQFPRCGSMYLEMSLETPGNSKETGYESHIYAEPILRQKAPDVALIKALKTRPRTTETETTDTKAKMATLRSKSPKPIITKNNDKESVWDKIGTLGRKKRSKEVQEVQEEGKYAIDSPGFAVTPIIPPEDYELDENEERSVIMPKAYEDPRLRELIQVLIDWINDELASQRIIVQDLTEDLYDGQVLQKLFEMLTGHKLDVPEVTQSEEGQKQKLSVVLSHFNRVLGLPHNHNKWNVEAIHSKNILPILHLLVAIARHFRPPVRLPENVSVQVTVVQKTQGQLQHRNVREVITSEYSDVGMRCERDAFDTLFDHAPDKLQVVKKSMVTFVNKHLNKLNLEVTEIETQFHDGVYLIMLMGLLEGFFVPLYSFFPTPKDNDQKIHNVAFAFELMEECGLARPKARPEDVVNLDLKSTLRVLYNLFNKYKSLL